MYLLCQIRASLVHPRDLFQAVHFYFYRSEVPPNFTSATLRFVQLHRDSKMVFKVPAKRGREMSVPATPSLGCSSSRPPSVPRSSPIRPVRPTTNLSQQPRVSLRPSTSRATSLAPSYGATSTAPSSRAGSTAPSDLDVRPENEAEIQEREENDALNEVVMAVDLRDRGTVGCCYYVATEEKLYFMEDVKHGGFDIIDTCKGSIHSHSPTSMLIMAQ